MQQMSLGEYERELQLIEAQNYTEFDLYHVIWSVLKKSIEEKDLSLRDVSHRRRGKSGAANPSTLGEIFYGLASFPDFVILDPKFKNATNIYNSNNKINIDNKKWIYGGVEIKKPDEKLPVLTDILKEKQSDSEKNQTFTKIDGQFLGELLWYKKLLYTNGIKWSLYELTSDKIGELSIDDYLLGGFNDRIIEDRKNKDVFTWYEYKDLKLSDIKVKEVFNIDLTVSGNTNQNQKIPNLDQNKWEELSNELAIYDWKAKIKIEK